MAPDSANALDLRPTGASPRRAPACGRAVQGRHKATTMREGGTGAARRPRPLPEVSHRPTQLGHGAAGANPACTGTGVAGTAGTAMAPGGAPQQGGALLDDSSCTPRIRGPAPTKAAIASCRRNIISFLHRNSAAAGVLHRRQEHPAAHRNANALPLDARPIHASSG